MKTTYYEAKGETKAKLMEMLLARRNAIDALDRWARTFGGRIATSDDLWGFRCVLDSKDKNFEPKETTHWKRTKHNQWTPRLSTKRGKEIAAEMRALSDKVEGTSKIGAYLKIPFDSGGFSSTGGFYITSIGLYPRKGRLAVVVKCNKYKPPKGIQLTRISDLDFEKLSGEKL
jgi:hypothetical protein